MHTHLTGLILLFIATFGDPLLAADKNSALPIPPSAEPGIDYLIDFVNPEYPSAFDISRLGGLFEFISSNRTECTKRQLPSRLKATPAYYEFEIKKELEVIFQLVYHPDIPLQMVSPGSVRFSQWIEVDGSTKPLPKLWTYLDNLNKPVVIRGVELEEITPDLNTGAYYRSVLDRALILLACKGRPVLVSLTKQKDVSGVGKKGFIIGEDDRWDYFYSGKKGLATTGLGWVDSYIYDSFSVVVYYEIDKTKPLTRCALFKWLRAGWLGANMVREKHIRSGFKRFERDMIRVVESPRLPDPEKLAAIATLISCR